MRLDGNTILITGGSMGIGLALAERFVKLGNTVIACGRREERLNEAKEMVPGLNAVRCDVSSSEDRKKLGSNGLL